MGMCRSHPLQRPQNPWFCSKLTLITTLLASLMIFIMIGSFSTRQLDQKGCSMSYMRPMFFHFPDFDSVHTRFGNKYSLYLYREAMIDEDMRVKGVPVLFVPGNAGSYKQVRPLAAQAAVQYYDAIQAEVQTEQSGKRPLDFFSVDFNEDFAAFHGRTLLDQAEYLNDAISYILALYHNSHRSMRDPDLPYPSSVILVGHSMGGIVARACFTLPNYQPESVNTIITLAAPHARAPISFDDDIVRMYKSVNDYWRQAYSQKWVSGNALWHVTLISIAGGGLDTTVPSDYSTLASLVPPTHGFTVFTSTIPEVWTSMDHLAITWCNQLRKIIIATLYDVIDASQPTQTKSRVARMKIFKKHFLTGLENAAEKKLLVDGEETLMIAESSSTILISSGKRLVLERLGDTTGQRTKTYLMPIPLPSPGDATSLKLLTNQNLTPQASRLLSVLICKAHPSLIGQQLNDSSPILKLPRNNSGSLQLRCRNAAADAILLPASTSQSNQPFDNFLEEDWNTLANQSPPFSYLQYDLEALTNYQFLAVVVHEYNSGQMWALAEFSSRSASIVEPKDVLSTVLFGGLKFSITNESIVSDIQLPSIHSSLLAYKLRIEPVSGKDSDSLFNPLLRQHLSEPFESKFFVNVKEADVNLHGLAPYVPSSPKPQDGVEGLSIQIWLDPTCNESMAISLNIDFLGSVGKFWMRYRAIVITFPLIVVALAFENQLRVYDETGSYISFSESVGLCLQSSIPTFWLILTLFSLTLSKAQLSGRSFSQFVRLQTMSKEPEINAPSNDLLLGLQDPFFWFLVPFFGVISIGISVGLNFAILTLTEGFAIAYEYLNRFLITRLCRSNTSLFVTSLQRKFCFSIILLFLVATTIPYQFIYIVICVVQMATCIRAQILAREILHSPGTAYFYNYAHSVLMLMLCVLPINIPTLVVWIQNLAVRWLTPFSSHHNILSVLPFVILVETLSTGKIIPRLQSPVHYTTSSLFIFLAVCTALYGGTHAYLLHSMANYICAWLSLIHLLALRFKPHGVEISIDDVNGKEMETRKKK